MPKIGLKVHANERIFFTKSINETERIQFYSVAVIYLISLIEEILKIILFIKFQPFQVLLSNHKWPFPWMLQVPPDTDTCKCMQLFNI